MILECVLSNYKSDKTDSVPLTQLSPTLWDVARGNNKEKEAICIKIHFKVWVIRKIVVKRLPFCFIILRNAFGPRKRTLRSNEVFESWMSLRRREASCVQVEGDRQWLCTEQAAVDFLYSYHIFPIYTLLLIWKTMEYRINRDLRGQFTSLPGRDRISFKYMGSRLVIAWSTRYLLGQFAGAPLFRKFFLMLKQNQPTCNFYLLISFQPSEDM